MRSSASTPRCWPPVEWTIFNIAEIRSHTRIVTQTISRSLYEQGAGGVMFGSNHDDQPCYALFEGHARLITAEDAELVELTADLEIWRSGRFGGEN